MTISPAAAAPDGDTAAAPRPFPRVFWAALGLEFLERLAFYMGLAIVPVGVGGLVGGVLSGRLIAVYLPKVGPRDPLAVWGVYALIGLACAASLAVFARVTRRANQLEAS
jgi:threonine dehydratase